MHVSHTDTFPDLKQINSQQSQSIREMNMIPTKVIILSVLTFSSCLSRSLIGAAQTLKTDIRVLQNGGDVYEQCSTMKERERVRNEIHQTVESVVDAICGGPRWRRIAFIDMTITSYNCPTGLSLTDYSKRMCGRANINSECSSTTFNVGGLPYSRVCGRIKGYQLGVTDAFLQFHQGIDSYYVDGVSLTHGSVGSRQHIWTFASGLTESGTANTLPYHRCPCDTLRNDRIPEFVGSDYFCESGLHSAWTNDQFVFNPNDPLWDGQNCTDNSTCCEFNNPPWFSKQLNASTTDDIELRICNNYPPRTGDVPLELIELYVQ